jgi:hypothetical protein
MRLLLDGGKKPLILLIFILAALIAENKVSTPEHEITTDPQK